MPVTLCPECGYVLVNLSKPCPSCGKSATPLVSINSSVVPINSAKAQVARLGLKVIDRKQLEVAIDFLTSFIKEDEKIIFMTECSLGNDKGFVVVTDIRLLFFRHAETPGKERLQTFLYEGMIGTTYELGIFWSTVYIDVFTEKIKFDISQQKDSLEFANVVFKFICKVNHIPEFSSTKTIGEYLEIDEENEQWRILVPNGFVRPYKYSDIFQFELLENAGTTTTAGADVTGALADIGGSLTNIFGSNADRLTTANMRKNIVLCTSLQIKITLKSMNNPAIYIDFIKSSCDKTSRTYSEALRKAQDCLSVFQILSKGIEPEKPEETVAQGKLISVADEILKFKNLLESGIISVEEFEAQKKLLLKT